MTTDEILDAIAKMTVMEAAELVKAMEEKFGVTAAAPVAVAAGPTAVADGEEAVEEQTEFNVVLSGFAADKKIGVIKEVRAITGLGLKEAKELVESGNGNIKEGVSRDDAKAIKDKLEAVGATIEVK